MKEPDRITVEEVVRSLRAGEDVVFVDARAPKSFAQSEEAIRGAIRIPPDEVAVHVSHVPLDRKVVTFCS
jgi:rhodanese-related sulfurtransferase